jgi:hypothetical protein
MIPDIELKKIDLTVSEINVNNLFNERRPRGPLEIDLG